MGEFFILGDIFEDVGVFLGWPADAFGHMHGRRIMGARTILQGNALTNIQDAGCRASGKSTELLHTCS